MPRDPNRIPAMLKLVGEVWDLSPHLRLGQLIWCATVLRNNKIDVFDIEDEELAKLLSELKELLLPNA